MLRLALLFAALGTTGACARPLIPVETAERQCADLALSQTGGPRTTTGGSVGMGVVSGGGGGTHMHTGLSLNLSTELGSSRDPNEVFTSCVHSRSGQFPTRPLYDRG